MRATSRIMSPCALQLAAFVLEPELGAQQSARIVGHAPQPGFVGALLFAVGGAFGALGLTLDFLALLGLHVALLQRTLHACALRGVGVALALFFVGLRRLRGLSGIARIGARCVRGDDGCRFVGILAFAGAAGVARIRLRLALLGFLLAVATAVVAWRRRRLALHRGLDGAPVGDGVGHPGLQAQGLVVGGDRSS